MDFLLLLPPEIISIILRKLSTIDLVNFALANERCERLIESDPLLVRRLMTFQNASFVNSMSLQKRNVGLENTLRKNENIKDYLRWFQNNRNSIILNWPRSYRYYRRRNLIKMGQTKAARYRRRVFTPLLSFKRKRENVDMGYEADDEWEYVRPRKRIRRHTNTIEQTVSESMDTVHE